MAEQGKPVVVVTGAAGLIGRRIIDRIGGDYQIVALDKKLPDDPPDTASWYYCDLTEEPSVRQTLEQVEEKFGSTLYSVIHLAAYYDFSGEPSPLYDKLTVEGTQRLLTDLNAQFNLGQFVFSSSILMMQPDPDGGTIDENSPLQAEWAYPQSKLEAEKVIREHRDGARAVLVRIAGVYDEDGNSLPLSQQISRIFEKDLESFVFPGNADHGQALIHLDDLADCFAAILTKRDELDEEEVFLISEPEALTYRQLQEEIGELIHGSEWPTFRVPKVVAKAGAFAKNQVPGADEFIKPWMVDLADAHYVADIGKARKKLDWEPQHRLADSLPEIIKRLKENPRQWYERHGLNYSGD